MGQKTDYQSLMVDPDFRALTADGKQRLLQQTDPDFAALSPQAQARLISQVPPAEEGTSNVALGQPQTGGDIAVRSGQEAVLGGLTGFGLPQFPETQNDRDSNFAGRAFNYMGKMWGGVQDAYTNEANRQDSLTTGERFLDPIKSPLRLVHSLGSAWNQASQEQFTKMDEADKAGNNLRYALHGAAGFIPLSAPAANAVDSIAGGIEQKDIPQAAHGIGTLGGLGAAIYGGAEPAAADALVGKVGGAVNQIVPKTPYNFQQLLGKAIRPSIKNVDQLETAISALQPDLQAALSGNKQTLDSVQQAVSEMRKSVWNQSQKLKPNASQMVNGKDIHEAILSSISPRTKMIYPEIAQAVEKRAKNYLVLDKEGNIVGSKQIPINDAEQFLQEAHADLDPYYNKSPFQQATNIRSSADVAATNAETDALRKAIHGQLADPTLRQKYGFLSSLDQQLQRRQAQVSISALNDLPDRMTKTAAAWGLTKAVLKADPQEAAGVLAGYAQNASLKAKNSPDWLLNKAFNPSVLGSTVPPGIVGPAAGVNAVTPHSVSWVYDPQSGSLRPADTPEQLQDQF